jgi:ribonuclease P protein subunit RPR2
MSKVKAPKTKGIANKHLHARSTFLYQAATYLTLQTAAQDNDVTTEVTQGKQVTTHNNSKTQRPSPLALQLGSDLQQVSRKGQLRLAVDLKRSVCKSCNTILIPGRTATQTIENPSKGGKKPWADVLVISCNLCGGSKRFPVGATKQLKKAKRKAALVVTTPTVPSEDAQPSNSTTVADTDHSGQLLKAS